MSFKTLLVASERLKEVFQNLNDLQDRKQRIQDELTEINARIASLQTELNTRKNEVKAEAAGLL